MFLRTVDVYLIFKHSQWKPKLFGIKINIDLEAKNVENNIFIWPSFNPFGLNKVGVTHGPLLLPKKAKPVG